MIRLTSILVLPLALCSVLDATAAQELPWRSLVHTPDRPSLNYIPAVVPDPADPTGESWYAFTPGYVWHTHDMGVNVRSVSEAGLDNLMLSALSVAHSAPDILYVATGVNHIARRITRSREASRFEGRGIYRSADRGARWERLPFFAGVPPGRDLRILNSISTSARGDTVLVTTTHRILRSVDAGQTWTEVHHLPRSLRNVFVTVHGSSGDRGATPITIYWRAMMAGGAGASCLWMTNHPPKLLNSRLAGFGCRPSRPQHLLGTGHQGTQKRGIHTHSFTMNLNETLYIRLRVRDSHIAECCTNRTQPGRI